MAKHFRCRYTSVCPFCTRVIKVDTIIVKVKDIHDSVRKKWFFGRMPTVSKEAWIHKTCYHAGIGLWRAERNPQRQPSQDDDLDLLVKLLSDPASQYGVRLLSKDYRNFNHRIDAQNFYRTTKHSILGQLPPLGETTVLLSTEGSILFEGLSQEAATQLVEGFKARGANVELFKH